MEPDNVTINCDELTEIAFLSYLHIKEFTLTTFLLLGPNHNLID